MQADQVVPNKLLIANLLRSLRPHSCPWSDADQGVGFRGLCWVWGLTNYDVMKQTVCACRYLKVHGC